MRRRVIVVGVLLAAALPAFAEDRARAERYFRLGEKAYQSQNFDAAAQNFEEAYNNFAIPEIAFSAAQAFRRQYRIEAKPIYVQKAVTLYRAYLGKVKSGGRVADAADALSEMQQELDKLLKSGVKIDPEIAKEYTRIVVNATLGKEQRAGGMQEIEDKKQVQSTQIVVRLDGKRVEPFAPINVTPDEHRISVEADGFFAVDRKLLARAGDTTIADVELKPMPATLAISTDAGARVSIDGRVIGTTPLPPQEVEAGTHVVSITRRARVGVAIELPLHRGEKRTLDEPLAMTTRRQVVQWMLVGAGATAAFMTGSIVLASRSDTRAFELRYDRLEQGDQTQEDLDRYNNAVRWRDRFVLGAWTSGAAVVALSGIAALLYYTDNPEPDGVRIEPLASRTAAGAAIAGRF